MASKPSIPKGTRDFSPSEVAKRQYIMQIIRSNFEKFGFQPIETPSFENSETLMGKYGEEGDRLIFKILNSGEFLTNVNQNLSKAIKTALFNLRIAISKSDEESFDFDRYKEVFLDVLPKSIRQSKDIKFDENYINIERLAIDIWIRISEILLPNDELYNKLLLKGDEKEDNYNINILSSIIFGDFYFQLGTKYVGNYISEKALRYDLTVPFARYVVQHQNEIEFPFKRYQIQPVWRADRPQKGRFREFFQCDADVVGSTSLWQEVELVQLYDSVFSELGLKGVTIKINNRKILSGIAEVIGASDKLIDFTVALDKLDKIGEDGVKKEMLEKGISAEAIEKVQPLFSFTGTISEKIDQLSTLLSSSVEGVKGVEELQFICENISQLGLQNAILDLDVTLARGLNYYTGAIFEVAPPKEVAMGSIGGGGRYDDLTGIFGLKSMSGVGISFGLDRIYLVIEELNLFPETVTVTTKALFINYGLEEAKYAMKAITALRKAGIKVELYPDAAKVGKQFGHADKRNIPFAVIAGSDEILQEKYALKNLISGEQILLTLSDLMLKLQA
ncbi:histidine--tRNA ligase [Flavobacterium sp.]|jgi:histidyl-tRNA synthetase|uniref:histidine--tRNA ligase n=1 Tax=Flavobacterium sp. TaxID=239 RepID=UPI0037C11D63